MKQAITQKMLPVFITSVFLLSIFFTGVNNVQAGIPPIPSNGMASVDGDFSEWDLVEDYFAAMYRAANSNFPILARLYLRYDCPSGVLYALVLAEPGVEVLDLAEEAFVKLGGTKLVGEQSGNDGTPPDFAYIKDQNSDKIIGWEASMVFPEGAYTTLNVHTQVLDTEGEEQTASVKGRQIEITTRCWYDFGDLPEGPPYNYNMTTIANNGARHIPQEEGVILGFIFDAENEGQPNTNANGDDTSNLDEDGVQRAAGSWGGGQGKVNVTVSKSGDLNSGEAGCLVGWLDYYNAAINDLEPDGIFQESFTFNGKTFSERIINNQYVTTGLHEFSFDLPVGTASGGVLYARFRLVPYDGSGYDEQTGQCKQAAVGLKGLVTGGEVEDYAWLFGPTAVTLKGFSTGTNTGSWFLVMLVVALSLVVLATLFRLLPKAQGKSKLFTQR